MATIQRRYIYKIYRNNAYIGNLENVVDDFQYSQDINSGFVAMTVRVAVAADFPPRTITVPGEPGDRLTTEASEYLTTEAGEYLTTEGIADTYGDNDQVVGNSLDTIKIRNNNQIKVYETSSYYPTGKLLFSGRIESYQASVGDEEIITINCVSDGYDLDEKIIQTGTVYTSRQSDSETGQEAAFGSNTIFGQYFVPASNYNLARAVISLRKAVGFANQTVTCELRSYSGSNPGDGTSTLLATVDVVVTSETFVNVTFNFPTPIAVTTTGKYLVILKNVATASGVFVEKKTPGDGVAPYSVGSTGAAFTDGHGDGNWSAGVSDMTHELFSLDTQSTTAPYTSDDPTDIFKSGIDDYHARGGTLIYSGSTDNTGLSVSYTFVVATALELVKKCLEMAPSNWYWRVDLSTNIIYFKETATTATYKLIKGRHIEKVELVRSIDNVKNKLYFSGGDIGAGVNLFKVYLDQDSIDAYGERIERKSDNRVTLEATADAIGNSFIEANKDEQYHTVVKIIPGTMDTTLPQVGETVAFQGFGDLLDGFILQIVRKHYSKGELTLEVGTLPPRTDARIDQINRDLNYLQTIANPDGPD